MAYRDRYYVLHAWYASVDIRLLNSHLIGQVDAKITRFRDGQQGFDGPVWGQVTENNLDFAPLDRLQFSGGSRTARCR